MKKCIIWGTGVDYERLYNSIQLEVYKGNIAITAVVTKEENIFCNYIDNMPLITKEVIGNVVFDYIIICSSLFFNEIWEEISTMGISRNRVLDGGLFAYARFDFNKYIQLIENPVTIISDDCWGGFVYNALGLPFNSPTINTSWMKEDYVKFVSDLTYYLRQPLRCGREGNLEMGESPVGLLGENERQVQISFLHNSNFNEAKQQWERRRDRVNLNNVFVKMGLDTWNNNCEYFMNIFDGWKYKKICFCPYVRDRKGYITSAFYSRWRWANSMGNRIDSYGLNSYARNHKCIWEALDILALLNGEAGCFRNSN